MKLIVTADDFGIGYETSRGIVEAHLRGPVTCTSLMTVCGDHVKRSLPLLADAPKLEVGLHLVMSGSDKPLVATAASGLLSREGTFLPLPKLMLRATMRRLDRAACLEEILAQAEAYQKLMGKPAPYVDGHHHSHQLPTIRGALSDAIERGALPKVTRATVEPTLLRRHVKTAPARRFIARRLGRSSQPYFQARGIVTNDSFFGMLDDADLLRPNPWDKYLAQLPTEGAVEWVVHPGFDDPTLIGRDEYIRQRVQEVKALTDPAQRGSWDRAGVERIVKSDLALRV